MRYGAEISQCGGYRYRLWRLWNDAPYVTWIMLNPSTADGKVDDPTIRRCVGFTRLWADKPGGHGEIGGLVVVNLYALRATDPMELAKHSDPVGPNNDNHVREVLSRSSFCIAAWGTPKPRYPTDFSARVAAMRLYAKQSNLTLLCLGMTKDGSPRHPLYLPYSAEPTVLHPIEEK